MYRAPPIEGAPARRQLRGFIFMALMFALNHGAAVACLSFAVAELGPQVGNASSGSLYLSFMCCALFGSAAVVRALGAKGGLVLGTSLYASYVLSFVAAAALARGGAAKEDTSVWIVAVIGGVLGGIAAGILLTSSGVYFSYAARDYARLRQGGGGPHHVTAVERGAAASTSFAASTTQLSGYLAGIFVGTEVACKLVASLIVYLTSTWIWMAIVFLGVSLISAVGMTRVDNVAAVDHGSGGGGGAGGAGKSNIVRGAGGNDSILDVDTTSSSPGSDDAGTSNNNDNSNNHRVGTTGAAGTPLLASAASALQVMAAWVEDPRLLLAGGVNLSFGFCSAYLTSYLNGVVVKTKYGGSAVGLFAAITPAVSGLSALPFAYCARRAGTKVPFMALACAASAGVALLGLSLGTAELGGLGVLLCVYVLEGWLRCVFEGINKAVFADLFLGQSEVAFATLIVQSGGASALAFWMMSVRVDERVVAWCTLCAAAAAMPMFWCAHRMTGRRKGRGGGDGEDGQLLDGHPDRLGRQSSGQFQRLEEEVEEEREARHEQVAAATG